MAIENKIFTYEKLRRVFFKGASVDQGESQNGGQAPDALEKELTLCRLAEAELKNKLTHLGADFDNFKRRVAKEQSAWMHEAKALVLIDLLAVIDDIDRALSHPVTSADSELKTWLQGFVMIQKSLHDFLKKHNVTEVPYEQFDPHYHEALMEVESTEHAAGHIVEVLQKGYRLGDRVLRPARVSVAR